MLPSKMIHLSLRNQTYSPSSQRMHSSMSPQSQMMSVPLWAELHYTSDILNLLAPKMSYVPLHIPLCAELHYMSDIL